MRGQRVRARAATRESRGQGTGVRQCGSALSAQRGRINVDGKVGCDGVGHAGEGFGRLEIAVATKGMAI